MYLGLDIGRQYVKMVSTEKTKDGFKVLDAGSRLGTHKYNEAPASIH